VVEQLPVDGRIYAPVPLCSECPAKGSVTQCVSLTVQEPKCHSIKSVL
jgi:hypothetical protein